jgi:DNA polymerase, archaea type
MAVASSPSLYAPSERRALLFGRDETSGIVSVTADRAGQARVWRREGDRVVSEGAQYLNWFFLARPELLDGLRVQQLPSDTIGQEVALDPGTVGLLKLAGTNPFQYLVLTSELETVERHVSERIHAGHEQGTLTEPQSELIYVRPAVEQYLTITGRTYFKGMTYGDVRRLQFDLETDSLDSAAGRIFMVAIKDSAGFAKVLDTERMTEAELIAEFARIVCERDPDIIENHNIFDFDIRFLMRRALALNVPLNIARDGSTFTENRDSLKVGSANESFTRYSLAGREIVDTYHAVKRYSAIQRDLRSNGLKETAKYFGVARPGRVYVDGAEIWPTFQRDPERVREYCFDDVDEVDHISPILLGSSFALASMVPRAYERIATSGTGQGLIEPLLVRAYVEAGHSLPAGHTVSGTFEGGRTAIFTTGIVPNVVKADVASLYPSIMLTDRIAPASDEAGAFLALLEELTAARLSHKSDARRADLPEDERVLHNAMQAAMKVLINSFYGMLGASFALFCDKDAAERVTARGREILQIVLDQLKARGATLVEADTDGVLFSLPPRLDGMGWTYEEEAAFIAEAGTALPAGVHLEHDGRYRAMYSYMEKNYALLDYEREDNGSISLRNGIRAVGVAFRSSKTEPLLERFLGQTLRFLLEDNVPAIRDLYRATCADLRTGRVPVADLCVSMPLSKDPQRYAQSERKEEAYEVYLAAGFTDWKANTRIRYYQARGRKKLFTADATDYDPDFYINRLRSTCLQRLDRALEREDLETVFSESPGLFDPPIESIRTLRVTSATPMSAAEDATEGDSETDDAADEPLDAL